jgi:hypothetical protein
MIPWKIWRVDIPPVTEAGDLAGRIVRVWFGPVDRRASGSGGCYFLQTLMTGELALTVARSIARGNDLRKSPGKHIWWEVTR